MCARISSLPLLIAPPSPLPPRSPSSKKKVGIFKRSQSYNDASRMAQMQGYATNDDDDDEEDFLDDLPEDNRGRSAPGEGIAARGRKFLRRISTRSGSNGEGFRDLRDRVRGERGEGGSW